MASIISIPEGLFPVELKPPTSTSAGWTTDWVSLKNAVKAWIVVHLTQAVGHATAFTLNRATAVAPTGNTTLANNVPIWYGNVSTSTHALTRQTDAKAYTMDVGVTGDVVIVYEVDPANLGDGYDCVALIAAASSQATDIASVMAYVQPRYASKPSTMSGTEYITD